jgi:hypothetical protein
LRGKTGKTIHCHVGLSIKNANKKGFIFKFSPQIFFFKQFIRLELYNYNCGNQFYCWRKHESQSQRKPQSPVSN